MEWATELCEHDYLYNASWALCDWEMYLYYNNVAFSIKFMLR